MTKRTWQRRRRRRRRRFIPIARFFVGYTWQLSSWRPGLPFTPPHPTGLHLPENFEPTLEMNYFNLFFCPEKPEHLHTYLISKAWSLAVQKIRFSMWSCSFFGYSATHSRLRASNSIFGEVRGLIWSTFPWSSTSIYTLMEINLSAFRKCLRVHTQVFWIKIYGCFGVGMSKFAIFWAVLGNIEGLILSPYLIFIVIQFALKVKQLGRLHKTRKTTKTEEKRNTD